MVYCKYNNLMELYMMLCRKCKNNIPDNSRFCLYCGSSQINGQVAKKENFSITAIVGFVLSLVSVAVSYFSLFFGIIVNFPGFLLSLSAIILSIVGLRQTRRKELSGMVLAIIGISIGTLAFLRYSVMIFIIFYAVLA